MSYACPCFALNTIRSTGFAVTSGDYAHTCVIMSQQCGLMLVGTLSVF